MAPGGIKGSEEAGKSGRCDLLRWETCATKGLNKDQQRAVHNEISGSGLGFHDIVDAAKHILFLLFFGSKKNDHKRFKGIKWKR